MARTERSEILPGTLEMLILETLTISPMHGYGIAQHLQWLSEDVLQVEEGALHPALRRMQLKGWVSSEWGQTPTGRRARYYKLTPLGKKQLAQEVADFDRLLVAIQRVMGTAGMPSPLRATRVDPISAPRE
jgi:transcriptional regulator